MLSVALLAFFAGQVIESKDFSREQQLAAVAATVRVLNVTKRIDGSGVIVRQDGPFVYLLTAEHVVAGAEQLEVATFSAASYPNPVNVYRSARVLAQAREQDLAVLRLATQDKMPGQLRIGPPGKAPKETRFAALTVGCSNGNPPTCRVEQVVNRKRLGRHPDTPKAFFWEMHDRAVRGRSGGPLLDKHGNLIGICSGSLGKQGYYCHVQEVHVFLRRQALKWLYEDDKGK